MKENDGVEKGERVRVRTIEKKETIRTEKEGESGAIWIQSKWKNKDKNI